MLLSLVWQTGTGQPSKELSHCCLALCPLPAADIFTIVTTKSHSTNTKTVSYLVIMTYEVGKILQKLHSKTLALYSLPANIFTIVITKSHFTSTKTLLNLGMKVGRFFSGNCTACVHNPFRSTKTGTCKVEFGRNIVKKRKFWLRITNVYIYDRDMILFWGTYILWSHGFD